MAMASVPHEEIFDDLTTLRGLARRQKRELADLRAEVTSLKATTANLTAAIGAILEYANPDRGTWVCSPDSPPEYDEYEPRPKTYAEYTALLFQVPAEVVRDGR